MVTVEDLLNLISKELIKKADITPAGLMQNQKTISRGVMSTGRTQSDKLVLFELDTDAYKEDLKKTFTTGDLSGETLETLTSTINIGISDPSQVSVDVTASPLSIVVNWPGGTQNVTDVITMVGTNDNGDEIIINPLNIGQYINFQEVEENIDPMSAERALDTNIYELLPRESGRQQQIDLFFDMFQGLVNEAPDFQLQGGLVGEDFSSDDYHWNNDITAPQEADEEATIATSQGMITRLDSDANLINQGKTLQSLRDTLNTYLVDIDEEPPTPYDDRPEYENQSEGYLKFRRPNQGIIIRNTNQDFIQGLNPDTLDYLDTGFTITMWVRFIDKTSEGTLFNFGNPLRGNNQFGFMLDTYVINQDLQSNVNKGIPGDGWPSVIGPDNNGNVGNPNGELFVDTDTERFVRLLLVEEDGKLRDSHLPNVWGHSNRKDGVPMQGWNNYNYATGEHDETLAPNQINVQNPDHGSTPTDGDGQFQNSLGLLNHVKIPYDPTEWYFIVATYNPDIDEDGSFDLNDCASINLNPGASSCNRNVDFWRGNWDHENQEYTHYSGFGSKCKVEIISKSDLLRARGYKV